VRLVASLLLPLVACTTISPAAHTGASWAVTALDDRPPTLEVSLGLIDFVNGQPYEGIHKVAVTFRGHELTLDYDGTIDPPYQTTIPLESDLAEGEPMTFVLERADEAPVVAAATAPADFVIAPPASTRATDPVLVTWSPTSSDPMQWAADPRCVADIGYADGPIPQDTGSIEFPPGVLARLDLPTKCTTSLAIGRFRESRATTPLAFDSVRFTRVHGTTVEVTP
jgi:hypothetical protein